VTQFSVAVRNARGNAIKATIGASAILKIRSGSKPTNCAAADSGTVISTLNLSSTWIDDFSDGSASGVGSWFDASADASGTFPAHFRIYASDGVTCHWQGTVTVAGDGGDMIVDHAAVTIGDQFAVSVFAVVEGNA
jgi:hypothetical protein